MPRIHRQGLKRDAFASVVVFLVALPLCMGIAIASGAPPAAGLITGIIGGIVVGVFSGAPMQVSGPAAGLSVIVYGIIQTYGDRGLQTLAIIVLLAGLIQIAAGLLRFGQWFRAVSPAVIRGMLAGIGVLIFASQFHMMVDDEPKGSGLRNLITLPSATWKGLAPMDSSAHHLAALVGVITISVMIVWRWAPKKLRVFPAPLAAVIVGTLATALFKLPIKQVTVPSNLLNAVLWPTGETLALIFELDIWLAAAAMALVASAETLLCATAVDQMQSGPRTRYDRELTAQGIGNSLCGLVGGLPMTGVIVRSAANVEAGAKTRMSAILHGVWILVFVAALPWMLNYIPTAALAALLVYTGVKLVDIKAIRNLRRYGVGELVIYFATVATIVAVDLLTGVMVGVALSVFKLLMRVSRLTINQTHSPEENRTTLHLYGAATFLRLPKLAGALERLEDSTELHVHIEGLEYIDHACLDLLMNWEKQHAAKGGHLVFDWESLTAKFHETGDEDSVETVQGSTPPPATPRPEPAAIEV